MDLPPAPRTWRYLIPLFLLLAMAAGAAFVAWNNPRLAEGQVEETAIAQLRRQGELLQQSLGSHLDRDDLAAAQRELHALAALAPHYQLLLSDTLGHVSAASNPDWIGQPLFRALPSLHHPETSRVKREQVAVLHLMADRLSLHGHFPVVLTKAVASSEQAAPAARVAILTIVQDLAAAKAQARQLAWQQSLQTSLALAALALLLGAVWHVTLVHRLEALAQAADQLADGQLDSPLEMGGQDDIARLANAFHHLADQMAEAAHQRQESETRLALALTCSGDIGWDWNLATGHFTLSPLWEELLGLPPGKLTGTPNDWRRHVHPDDLPLVTHQIDDHLKGRTPRCEFVHRVRTQQGEWRWLLARGRVVATGDQGEPARISGTLRDVTLQQTLEQAYQTARAQAESAILAKGVFLATLGHEIRTPLHAILGMAELLAESPLNAEQSRYVTIFQHAGESLLDIINDVLEFSQVETGRLPLYPHPFQPRVVVEEVVRICAQRAHEQGIALHWEVSDATPQAVVGDSRRLRQVLINLVSNAIRRSSRGRVTLLLQPATESQAAARAGRPDMLWFQVRDSGPPLTPSEMESLFDPFAQGSADLTRQPSRTGLGLAIGKRLVEAMEGVLWVEPAAEQGVILSFTAPLPAVVWDPADLETPGYIPFALTGRQVLLMMADPDQRLPIERLLHAEGISFSLVENPAEAWRWWRREDPAAPPCDLLVVNQAAWQSVGNPFEAPVPPGPLPSQAPVVLLTEAALEEPPPATPLRVLYPVPPPVKRQPLLRALQQALAHQQLALQTPQQRVTILLVEDAQDNVLLVKAFLKGEPWCKLEVASHGQEGIALWRQHRYDLILMDLQMPVMDGLAATREIRRLEALHGGHTPIVALTAHAMAEFEWECLSAGCDGHVAKPVKKATLLRTIRAFAKGPAA